MGQGQLTVQGIDKSFRGLRAVSDVSFSVAAGEIVGLIGPNGAGKTTIFNLVAGALAPDRGQIQLGKHAIAGLRPDQICKLGVGRTFQITRPFAGLSVLENVTVGALVRERSVPAARAHAERVLERLGFADKLQAPAASLTLPERKRLEIARALATRPCLLLLDEVMAGLRPTETEQLIDVFRQINKADGLTILMIEHVMRAMMALAQRIIVLHHGEVIAHGVPEEVVRDPAVVECYLGEERV
jgi:branched-chain amino acid transport system ATP-binding protein